MFIFFLNRQKLSKIYELILLTKNKWINWNISTAFIYGNNNYNNINCKDNNSKNYYKNNKENDNYNNINEINNWLIYKKLKYDYFINNKNNINGKNNNSYEVINYNILYFKISNYLWKKMKI